MVQFLVKHRVKDYGKWKPVFDEHGSKRRTSGSRGGRLFKNSKDPNELLILFEWEDQAKALQFAQSDDLRQAMERAGVVGKPEVYFLEEIEKFAG